LNRVISVSWHISDIVREGELTIRDAFAVSLMLDEATTRESNHFWKVIIGREMENSALSIFWTCCTIVSHVIGFGWVIFSA
jgi:hypothetical protein